VNTTIKGDPRLCSWPAEIEALTRALADAEIACLRARLRGDLDAARRRRAQLLRQLEAAKAGAMNDDFPPTA
jgi:hypothetical protein